MGLSSIMNYKEVRLECFQAYENAERLGVFLYQIIIRVNKLKINSIILERPSSMIYIRKYISFMKNVLLIVREK